MNLTKSQHKGLRQREGGGTECPTCGRTFGLNEDTEDPVWSACGEGPKVEVRLGSHGLKKVNFEDLRKSFVAANEKAMQGMQGLAALAKPKLIVPRRVRFNVGVNPGALAEFDPREQCVVSDEYTLAMAGLGCPDKGEERYDLYQRYNPDTGGHQYLRKYKDHHEIVDVPPTPNEALSGVAAKMAAEHAVIYGSGYMLAECKPGNFVKLSNIEF